MSDLAYRLEDQGNRRVLTVDGRAHVTGYSARVVRMLIERKGPDRAALYFPFKETRGRHYLEPLLAYLRDRGARDLSVLEVGCSFGHMTEYLADQPEVREISSFDTDPAFVDIVRAKSEELRLEKLRDLRLLSNEETRRLPYPDGRFDVVVVVGVIEHLPVRGRQEIVSQYYRTLAPGGHIAILDTPNRFFPFETHSVGLPLVQWLPAPLAFLYARVGRPRRFRGVGYGEFTADGTGWRNASLGECLPVGGRRSLEDVTEEAGYGWSFFQRTARSRRRRLLLPVFAAAGGVLKSAGLPPSLALPYFNLLFRKTAPR